MRFARLSKVSVLLLAVACGSGSEPTGLGLGQISGSWAGAAWNGDVGSLLVQHSNVPDTLVVAAARPRGSLNPLEDVVIRIPAFAGIGTYSLEAGAARFHELVGGEVVATYAGTDGELTITAYSGAGGIVEGTFTFDATSADVGRSYGDAARFENGHFIAFVNVPNPRPVPQ